MSGKVDRIKYLSKYPPGICVFAGLIQPREPRARVNVQVEMAKRWFIPKFSTARRYQPGNSPEKRA